MHDANADFKPNYKDWLLAVAQGELDLGSILCDGHIWTRCSEC